MDYDTSFRESVTTTGNDENFDDPIVQWYFAGFENGYGTSLSNLSAKLFWEDADILGPHEMFPDGYIQICDR